MENLPSRFLDGKSSSPHSVQIELGRESLFIHEEGRIIATWNYASVFVKEDWADAVGGIFGEKNNPDAGLAIFYPRLFAAIQVRLLHRHKASFIIPTKIRYLLLLSVLAGAAIYLLFPLINHLAAWTTYFIPHSLEKKLGNLALNEMGKEFPVCEDKLARANLQKIMDRLVLATGQKNLKPDIYFYKSSQQNAFTLPGQHFAILTGFLEAAKNEEEIAGVMAHEMGHMVHRDALEAFIEGQGFQVIGSLIGSSSAYGDLAKVASVMQTLSYSREKEYAADMFAVQLLSSAGYSSSGLSGFLSRIDAQEKDGLEKVVSSLEFLSTHPDTRERIRLVNVAAAKFNAGQNKASLSGAEFLRLKEACSRMP